MYSLRIFPCILVVGFCILMHSNGQRKTASVEEDKYLSGEFKLHAKSPTNDSKTSIGINQLPSRDGSSSTSSKADRKILVVWLKSIFQGKRGLSVFDSGELIYRVSNAKDGVRNKEVLLMNDEDEVVFRIRRKVVIDLNHRHMISVYEGDRGPGSSAVTSTQGSFRVRDAAGNRLQGHIDRCKATYDGNQYFMIPCTIEKSSNAKVDFKIVTAEEKPIAELKRRHVDGRGIPLGNDMLKLEVEPEADVSFVVALVSVFSMINNIL